MPVERMLHPRIGDSDKIAKLTDGEFRVWIFYLLAADDFGVVPMQASKFRGVDRGIANWPTKRIDRALSQIVTVNLCRTFVHQGASYLWAANWQTHQSIRYPRREQTHYPAVPEADLIALDIPDETPTRGLFATFHLLVSEAFRRQFGDPDMLRKIADRDARRSGGSSEPFAFHSGNGSGMSRTVATLTRAGAPETLTPNAQRLTPNAEVGKGTGETPPLDVWFRELQAAYPPQSVTSGHLTETAFCDVIFTETAPPRETFDRMLANLANQTRGHQWRVKRMIPRLDNWLRSGAWKQQHDQTPPATLVTEKTVRTMTSASAFAKGGADGP